MSRYIYSTSNSNHLCIDLLYSNCTFCCVPLSLRFITPSVTDLKSLHVCYPLMQSHVLCCPSHHIGWTPRKSPIYRMHGPCLLDWRPVFDANWVCVCKCVEKCVRRGYSSLSLRTKSLYICTYVVLKSYTFGLSGVGPGSFTWDPVPNDRTSNPRLLQRNEKNKTANYILICSKNKGDTKWLAFCLILLDLDTSTGFSKTFESLSARICTTIK